MTTTDIEKKHIVYDHGYDNMDRGNHEFVYDKAVIDPHYFQTNEFARGDIVFYKGSPLTEKFQNSISRVIALPNETVKIVRGQVYVNNNSWLHFMVRLIEQGKTCMNYNNY